MGSDLGLCSCLDDWNSKEVTVFCLFQHFDFKFISHVESSIRIRYLIVVEALHHYDTD